MKNSEENTSESEDNVRESALLHAKWTVDHEIILIEWADKAMCYRWLHAKANSLYSNLNALYTIPVIIISTLTGTANFAQGRVPLQYQDYYAMAVGALNLIGGIVTTVQQFLKITQLNEAHRVSSIAWDKFYRNIKVELAKHPDERMQVVQMIKICKEEFDRLMETSPNIPDAIILEFKKAFEKIESNKPPKSKYFCMRMYNRLCGYTVKQMTDAANKLPVKVGNELSNRIIKPEICDELVSTNDSRNKWYTQENQDKALKESLERIKGKNIEEQEKYKSNITEVVSFKKQFFNFYNREPEDHDIIDNLKSNIEMGSLLKIIKEQKDGYLGSDAV